MLVFTVLATLLCSSLIDARLTRVDSTVALEECKSQTECNNAALEINPPKFYPKIKASPPGEEKLSLAVEANQPLVFPVKAESYQVTWEIGRPDDTCSWQIGSNQDTITFREKSADRAIACSVIVGDVVKIAFRFEGPDIVVNVNSESCDKNPPTKLSACTYALPDSGSLPGWEIWTLSVTASSTSDPKASITLKDAYVVYDALEPPTTTSPGGSTDNTNGTDNATDPIKSGGATSDVLLGTMWTIILIVSGLM